MVRSSFARLLGERFPLFHQRAERLLGRFLFFVNFAVALIVASGLFKPLLDLGDGRFLRRNFLFTDGELPPRLLGRAVRLWFFCSRLFLYSLWRVVDLVLRLQCLACR